jgi:3-dehydroquinate synthase
MRDRHLKILHKVGLPTSYPKSAWSALLGYMQNDKKANAGGIRFVAVTDDFSVNRLEGVPEEILRRAYERIAT